MRYRIVNTDNFGRDYPNESFLTQESLESREGAQTICDILNAEGSSGRDRYWKVVDMNYKLQPGFEP